MFDFAMHDKELVSVIQQIYLTVNRGQKPGRTQVVTFIIH